MSQRNRRSTILPLLKIIISTSLEGLLKPDVGMGGAEVLDREMVDIGDRGCCMPCIAMYICLS
jgi:hypothetical protein